MDEPIIDPNEIEILGDILHRVLGHQRPAREGALKAKILAIPIFPAVNLSRSLQAIETLKAFAIDWKIDTGVQGWELQAILSAANLQLNAHWDDSQIALGRPGKNLEQRIAEVTDFIWTLEKLRALLKVMHSKDINHARLEAIFDHSPH